MTVRRGPFKSIYAGHAALHSSIVTGLILTLSQSLPVYSHTISSLPVYSLTLAACLFLTLRLTACVFLHYLAHGCLLSHCWARHLSSLHYQLTFSHYQAYCMSTLTCRLTAYLFSHSDSLPVYSHTIRLTLSILTLMFTVYLFSHPCSLAHQCIRALSSSQPIYSHTQN